MMQILMTISSDLPATRFETADQRQAMAKRTVFFCVCLWLDSVLVGWVVGWLVGWSFGCCFLVSSSSSSSLFY